MIEKQGMLKGRYFSDHLLTDAEHEMSFDEQVEQIIEDRIIRKSRREDHRKIAEEECNKAIEKSYFDNGMIPERKKDADKVGVGAAFIVMFVCLGNIAFDPDNAELWFTLSCTVPSIVYIVFRVLTFITSKQENYD
jgi:hypothetical protein